MNNLNITFDKTPKGNNKFDNSPHTNLSIPGFKTPMNQFVFGHDADNSKGFQRAMDVQDFESKYMALTQRDYIDPFMTRTPVGNTPMNVMRNFGEDEGEISKTFGNTSRAVLGDYSYRKQDPKASPMNRLPRQEEIQMDNKGLTFEQAAYHADNVCPCCRQMLPRDRKNINWNYDRSYVVVPNNSKAAAMSPSTVNFPNNESVEPNTPNPPSKSSQASDDRKSKGKNKRKRKNKAQVKKLEEEFAINPHWTNEDVDRISNELKLDRSQIYKWNWDQKKKLNILPSKVYVVQVPENFNQGSGKYKVGEQGTKQVYVKSIQDLLKLQSLASLKPASKKSGNK